MNPWVLNLTQDFRKKNVLFPIVLSCHLHTTSTLLHLFLRVNKQEPVSKSWKFGGSGSNSYPVHQISSKRPRTSISNIQFLWWKSTYLCKHLFFKCCWSSPFLWHYIRYSLLFPFESNPCGVKRAHFKKLSFVGWQTQIGVPVFLIA